MPELTRRQSMSLLGVGGFAALTPSLSSAGARVDLAELTIVQASAELRRGSIKSADLTQACLDRIDALDPRINSLITVMRTSALSQSAQLDKEAAQGRFRSSLHGLPVVLKDNVDTAGTRTTAGSAVFDDRVPSEDATVCAKLKAAGAVIIGKANMDEFASGGASVVSAFGPVHNPWNLDHVAGGSSGGSAAAVSAGLALAAIGTDTGGSIRIPSAFCGTVGLKPTHGLVSCRGIVPLVISGDTCGPIARSVEDVAYLLTLMVGYDKFDPASVSRPPCDYVAALNTSVSALRVGIARAPFFDQLNSEIGAIVEGALADLGKICTIVEGFSLPSTSHFPSSMFLAEWQSFHRNLLKEAPGRYMKATRSGLQAATSSINNMSTATCAEKMSDYIVARQSLEIMRRTVDDSFGEIDLIVFPTTRQPASTIEHAIAALKSEPDHPTLDFANNAPMNILGLPALSLPCGFTRSGMPVGLTIAGPHFSEFKILALGHRYERSTDWHRRRPRL